MDDGIGPKIRKESRKENLRFESNYKFQKPIQNNSIQKGPLIGSQSTRTHLSLRNICNQDAISNISFLFLNLIFVPLCALIGFSLILDQLSSFPFSYKWLVFIKFYNIVIFHFMVKQPYDLGAFIIPIFHLCDLS